MLSALFGGLSFAARFPTLASVLARRLDLLRLAADKALSAQFGSRLQMTALMLLCQVAPHLPLAHKDELWNGHGLRSGCIPLTRTAREVCTRGTAAVSPAPNDPLFARSCCTGHSLGSQPPESCTW